MQALLDSGASVNCIDTDLANRVGGIISRKARGVLLYPDKRQADVRGITELEVRVKGILRTSHVLGCKRVREYPCCWESHSCDRGTPRLTGRRKEMTFSDGVVWKAVGNEKEVEKKTKGPIWRFPSE